MLVLGITGGWDAVYEKQYKVHNAMRHDAAAVLIDNGKVVAAIEEERLNRIKHTNKAPLSAIQFCLDRYGVKLGDVDKIAVHGLEDYMNYQFRQYYLTDPRQQSFMDARALHQHIFRRHFGVEVDDSKLAFVNHHLAHAVTAYAPSGFDRSLVLTVDAYGDGLSGMLMSGEGASLKRISNFLESKSLGRFYLGVIRFLGYDLFDEYKVMGLAPYGDASKYRHHFKEFYTLLPDGDYVINMSHLHALFNLVPVARAKDDFTQEHKDIAAALQESLEEIIFHVLKHQQQKTRHTKLCLAGGVAHNCSMNGKVLYSGLFEDVFVQPASHDAGGALGAALYVSLQHQPQTKPARVQHIYWGTDIGDDDTVCDSLTGWEDFITFEKSDNVAVRAAQLLADGRVIGWAQGQSEFGPRALGNRSILADPRPAENKDLINAMVKKREAYRPFAPSVLEEYVEEFFDVPRGKKQFPFMVFVVKVQKDKQALLGAVTHVDGTARIHSVSRDANSRYWDLINSFRELTGVPVLLNTSFNNNVEPIVDSAEDALVCFLTTKLDYLVVGDYIVSKNKFDDESFLNLVPKLASYAKLNRTRKFTSTDEMMDVYEVGNSYNDRYAAAVSPEVFAMLSAADGHTTMRELIQSNGAQDNNLAAIVAEFVDLWSRRVVKLNPPRTSTSN